MQNEQIIPLALSGAEIKKIAHDKLDRILRSCHLNDNLAYADGVYMKISVELKLKDLGREIDQTSDIEFAATRNEQGQVVPADPEEYASLNAMDASLEQQIIDPTSARIESGQDVPVRVTDKSGKDDIKQVRYRQGKK